MRNALLVAVAIVEFLAGVPYFLDVIKGKNKPNIASWSTWTLLNGIIIVSALAAGGALNTVVLGVSLFAVSSTILILGLFKGTRKYTKFDALCQSIAIAGILLWQLTDNPNYALLFVIITDVFALTPTVRHAFTHPHEETAITYFILGCMALVLTALASPRTFASLAITIESAALNLGLASLVFVRERQLGMSRKDIS